MKDDPPNILEEVLNSQLILINTEGLNNSKLIETRIYLPKRTTSGRISMLLPIVDNFFNEWKNGNNTRNDLF